MSDVWSLLSNIATDAWERSIYSYSYALEQYNGRVAENVQPETPYFNVFSVEQQNIFLCYANALYLLITVALFGYMKRRPAGFRLRWILVLYDGCNVLIASYIALTIVLHKLNHGGQLVCNTLANDPDGYRLSRAFALFYLQKYFEFLDTWFFILRKSSRQVTFLHLFHHSSITVVVGSILPFDYNADMYLPILLNSANHTLLYLHYLLATLGLKSWWAPYITSLQLLQFCVIFGQSVASFRAGPDCGSPDFAKVLMIVYMGSMIALFVNFFLQKYVFRRPVQSLDMCGVVKRPPNLYPNIPSQYCGIAVLDNTGSCVVVLPEDFPDEERMARELGPSRTPFCVVYSLTAMLAPMPTLHIAREVGRAPAQVGAAGTTGSPNSTRATTHVPLKLSSNSVTAVAGSGEKKSVSDGARKQQAQKSRSGSGSRGQVTPSSPAELPAPQVEKERVQDRLLSLPFPPKFSNANVVKSASISDFRVLPSYNSFGGDSRNSSSGNLLLHNDRLIDGPLPLSESFELINRYSQQIRTGISESIFRLTLGALAAEERCHDEPEEAHKELSGDAAAGAAAGDGEESIGVCGALGAEDRRENFSGINDADADGSGSLFAPLTFVIAGGMAGGTVSWVVHTAPVVSSGNPNTALVDDAGKLRNVDGRGSDGGAGQPRLRSPSRTPPVGSTGIIRSTSVGTGLEDLVQPGQQQAEYAEDYALDWRAIS